MIIIGLLIRLSSKGPAIHWADRIGKDNTTFKMAKFRTMKTVTPVIDFNQLINPESYYVPFGSILRKTGFDELPQIYNVLKGDMSFVGPRPVLYNHFDVLDLRKQKGLDNIRPGLTGLAQTRGQNHISAINRVRYDKIYVNNISLFLDLKLIVNTALHIIRKTLQNKSKL